ncbi:MAG TPA: hypothetical protein VJI97_02320 [Candidatus Nanoarchaeia archaeon]|nr:hypothetical protein [Candidatus Nanoarchaeia archaeon]
MSSAPSNNPVRPMSLERIVIPTGGALGGVALLSNYMGWVAGGIVGAAAVSLAYNIMSYYMK